MNVLLQWCRRGRCVPTFHFAPNDEGAHSSKTTLDSLLAPSGDGSSNWTTVSDCRSGCLYGADDTLSGGSVGITTLIRTCPGQHTCPKVTVHYQVNDYIFHSFQHEIHCWLKLGM